MQMIILLLKFAATIQTCHLIQNFMIHHEDALERNSVVKVFVISPELE